MLSALIGLGGAGALAYFINRYYKAKQNAMLVASNRTIAPDTNANPTDVSIDYTPMSKNPNDLTGRSNPIKIYWPATINDLGVQKIATAIATAEGFFVTGSRPQRNHNPGDLRVPLGAGALAGYDRGTGLIPYVQGMRDGYVVYISDNDGWNDLKKQVTEMLNGQSQFYQPDMTLSQVARIYTATSQDGWARNAAGSLGVSTEDTLRSIYQAASF